MHFPKFTGDLISARPFLVRLCLYPYGFMLVYFPQHLKSSAAEEYLIGCGGKTP